MTGRDPQPDPRAPGSAAGRPVFGAGASRDGAPPPDAGPALLARSVTHELRQSLWLIGGYAELLARAPDELTRAELLREIRRAASRLAGSLAKLERAEALETIAFGPFEEYRVLDLRA